MRLDRARCSMFLLIKRHGITHLIPQMMSRNSTHVLFIAIIGEHSTEVVILLKIVYN